MSLSFVETTFRSHQFRLIEKIFYFWIISYAKSFSTEIHQLPNHFHAESATARWPNHKVCIDFLIVYLCSSVRKISHTQLIIQQKDKKHRILINFTWFHSIFFLSGMIEYIELDFWKVAVQIDVQTKTLLHEVNRCNWTLWQSFTRFRWSSGWRLLSVVIYSIWLFSSWLFLKNSSSMLIKGHIWIYRALKNAFEASFNSLNLSSTWNELSEWELCSLPEMVSNGDWKKVWMPKWGKNSLLTNKDIKNDFRLSEPWCMICTWRISEKISETETTI